MDTEKQFKRVEVSLRRWELRRAALLKEEEAVRAQVSGKYESVAAKEQLRQDAMALASQIQQLDPERMQQELRAAERQLEASAPPPGLENRPLVASLRQDAKAQSVLVVPSGGKLMSMFDPALWSAMDPLSFPYGDGVFGVEREAPMSYEQWSRYLLSREELEYISPAESSPDPVTASACPQGEEATRAQDSVSPAELPLPRWRADRDLQMVLYCLWRRRAYISAGRLMARKQIFQRLFSDAGKLTPAEMYETCELLGKGAGLKEVFARADVPPRVKQAMRTLLLCMSTVVGSNAHRTMLRHVNNSYKLLFGPPLVFVTPNVADVKSPVMWLLYRGEEVSSWRILEHDAPEMPAVREMLRVVARDPISQAVFFDVTVSYTHLTLPTIAKV